MAPDDPTAWSEEVRRIAEAVFGSRFEVTLSGEYPHTTLHVAGANRPAAYRLWGNVALGEGLVEPAPPWEEPSYVALEIARYHSEGIF